MSLSCDYESILFAAVSLCTTENLVSAYMNTCNSHSVRPLQKLISQLNVSITLSASCCMQG